MEKSIFLIILKLFNLIEINNKILLAVSKIELAMSKVIDYIL